MFLFKTLLTVLQYNKDIWFDINAASSVGKLIVFVGEVKNLKFRNDKHFVIRLNGGNTTGNVTDSIEVRVVG